MNSSLRYRPDTSWNGDAALGASSQHVCQTRPDLGALRVPTPLAYPIFGSPPPSHHPLLDANRRRVRSICCWTNKRRFNICQIRLASPPPEQALRKLRARRGRRSRCFGLLSCPHIPTHLFSPLSSLASILVSSSLFIPPDA